MAQLSDDCFAFSGPLLRLDDMERLIKERIAPVPETEKVALHGARGRVVAADVKAPIDLPPFDNSAGAGYGVWKGAGRTAARQDAGLIEILTFPFPIWHDSYQPLLPSDIPYIHGGYAEFPPEVGNESKYPYVRDTHHDFN